MKIKFLVLITLAVMVLAIPQPAHAQDTTGTPDITPTGTPVTDQGIIDAFNAIRNRQNMRGLIVDPILEGLAQQTADFMAINGMSGHIGDVRGRAIAAGYGAGDIPWLTENFAIGPMSLEELMLAWSDADHMRGANNAWYAHVGIGIAENNGDVYYVMIAGYTSNRIYKPGATALPGVSVTPPISQVMYPVVRVTAGTDGRTIHTVQHGQTLWAIAIAYNTHIVDIQKANNFVPGDQAIYEGQELNIPIEAALPTPSCTDNPEIQGQTATAARLANRQAEFTPLASQTSMAAPDQGMSEEFPVAIGAIVAALILLAVGLFISKEKSQ